MYAPNIANSAPIDITPSDIWTFLRQDRLQRPRVPVSFSLVESATRNSSRVLWIVETLYTRLVPCRVGLSPWISTCGLNET